MPSTPQVAKFRFLDRLSASRAFLEGSSLWDCRRELIVQAIDGLSPARAASLMEAAIQELDRERAGSKK
jgi:hypothetical protein